MLPRKGQAAMDLLMRYGWVLIVVLGIIAALSYFGIFSPGNSMPDTFLMGSILGAGESKLSTNGTLSLKVINSYPSSIRLGNVTLVVDVASDVTCTPQTTDQVKGLLLAERSVSPFISFTCQKGAALPTAGDRLKATLIVGYTKIDETLPHQTSGTLSLRAE
jgi:hypothetical protein